MNKGFQLSEQDQTYFEKGIKLYNDGLFFEAHEDWEVLWKKYETPHRLYFQALIQLTSGYLKIQEGVPAGALKHFLKAQEKFNQFPDSFLKVNNGEIKQKLAVVITELNSSKELFDSTKLIDEKPNIFIQGEKRIP